MKVRTTATIFGLLLGFAGTPVMAAQNGSKPAVKPPVQGPASAELQGIVEAGQKDRQFAFQKRPPTKQEADAMTRRDKVRLERVRALVNADKLTTSQDYGNAALVFQHSNLSDDYLIAHELSLAGQLMAGRMSDNLFALAEDRFLLSIGKKQRFGAQGAINPKPGDVQIQSTDETGETAVTNALRADLLMPPLADAKRLGPTALADKAVFDAVVKRIEERTNPAWQAEARRKPEFAELQELLVKAMIGYLNEPRVVQIRARTLALYRADELGPPEGYRRAAAILLRTAQVGAGGQDDFLLAHELAIVAALRGDKEARPVCAATLDAYLVANGRAPRYGTTKTSGVFLNQLAPVGVFKTFHVPFPGTKNSKPVSGRDAAARQTP